MIVFYNSKYFSKLDMAAKKMFTQIFIYFSKPLRLLYSLIIIIYTVSAWLGLISAVQHTSPRYHGFIYSRLHRAVVVSSQ